MQNRNSNLLKVYFGGKSLVGMAEANLVEILGF